MVAMGGTLDDSTNLRTLGMFQQNCLPDLIGKFMSVVNAPAKGDSSSEAASDPYFQKLFADRIGGVNYGKGTEIYKFEKIKRAKRKALADHPDRQLLDFGIGENDSMAAAQVREVMKREVDRPENRGYADNGVLEYKQAAARFMKRHFGVDLDPVTQINHCIGSKPAYAMLPACFINRATSR